LNFPKESTCGVPEWLICSVLCSVPIGSIAVFPVSKIQNEPERCDRKYPNWYIWNVPIILISDPNSGYFRDNLGTLQTHLKCSQFSSFLKICLQCSQIGPKIYQVGITDQNDGDIPNVPIGVFSITSFWLILNFTDWEHCNRTNGNTAKDTANEPLGNTTGTFFRKIQDVPTTFLFGTSWYTVNVLAVFCQ